MAPTRRGARRRHVLRQTSGILDRARRSANGAWQTSSDALAKVTHYSDMLRAVRSETFVADAASVRSRRQLRRPRFAIASNLAARSIQGDQRIATVVCFTMLSGVWQNFLATLRLCL